MWCYVYNFLSIIHDSSLRNSWFVVILRSTTHGSSYSWRGSYTHWCFHLGTFHNTGPSWVCGVVVMSIKDDHIGFPGLSQLDPITTILL
ncbi:hypothetical protein PHAVU_005G014100 [Phaseolus vulgaris]|uniref:Uncharacterized protein n=1 Tax=Phaseolus vulgaris TaxID=3885 RepID=V7BS44_PHAVU|nr:hypothetical protein PHAVU_005G014100g [Phaseolus vulgaris]ESW20779.1 hypothetical protein PHAVU_005G014100g [Phaseolus vulgaris]